MSVSCFVLSRSSLYVTTLCTRSLSLPCSTTTLRAHCTALSRCTYNAPALRVHCPAGPYIVRYYTAITAGTELNIVMEFLSGGSVLQLLRDGGPLPEECIAGILWEVRVHTPIDTPQSQPKAGCLCCRMTH